MTIIAKPTLYQGVRFRSRLEARWAVFFDALGLAWTYEPIIEGVNGYLPDFQIGPLAFVEVKPDSWSGPKQDLDKFADFLRVTDRALFVCVGEPGKWRNGQRFDGANAYRLDAKGSVQVRWEECGVCGSLPFLPTADRVCGCIQEYGQLNNAFNAVRDFSYQDAP